MLYFLSFILFFVNSCTEKNKDQSIICTGENTVQFPPDAFARFYFKDSTFWIYKDSASGQLDSAWVFNSKTGTAPIQTSDANSKGKCYQYGEYDIKSLLGIDYSFSLFPTGGNGGANYFDLRLQILNTSTYIVYANLKENMYRDEGIADGIIDSLSAIHVNGKDYTDVLVRRSTIPVTYPDVFSTAYYVKNIGLIKYMRPNGSVWELVKYKTKQ